MKLIEVCLSAGVLFATTAANADEKLPVLKSGDEVYSNVTVTSVTATDVYFNYSGGMGNAKLKNLEPEMQKHFHFDAAKAGTAEKDQAAAAKQFQRNVVAETEDRKSQLLMPTYLDDGDLVVRQLFARSFRGQRPPQVIVDQWLTPSPPNPAGKFVLVFFWVTSAPQCRNVVPHLNDLFAKFKDRLIVIGLSNEPAEEILKMHAPKVDFYVGTDTQSRTLLGYGVTGLPHAVVIDPAGYVRYEGLPNFLDEKSMAHLIDTYGK